MIMRKKVIISLIYVSIVLTIPLAVACQGSNDDSIDPVSYTHLDVYKRQQRDCSTTPYLCIN